MAGPLRNERHERFAQELAKGTDQIKAWRAAGYRGSDAVASRAAARPEVRARVAELQARAAARAEITVASVTERLLRIADKAEVKELGASGLAVARAALVDVAKLNGINPERHEHTGRNGGPIEYRDLSDEEVEARIAAHEAAGAQRPTAH